MKNRVHHYPSVGSLVKKVIEINPNLTVKEIMEMIRKATRQQQNTGSDFVSAEIVDEALVIKLAHESLSTK